MSGFQKAVMDLIPNLRRYAFLLTGERGTADDLVELALLRTVERRTQFPEEANHRAWLFTIMHDVLADRLNGTAPPENNSSTIDLRPRNVVYGVPDHRINMTELEAALARLPFEYRSTLLLVVLERLSYEEVADATGVTVGTVTSRLSKAREALRQGTSQFDMRHERGVSAAQNRLGDPEHLPRWTAVC